MDPPAWNPAEEFQYSRRSENEPNRAHPHRDEENLNLQHGAADTDAAVHQGRMNGHGHNNAKGDQLPVPTFKDQVRRADGEDVVAQGDSIIPLAQSVHILVEEDEPPEPEIMPAIALQAFPSGINAKNTVGTVEPPPPAANPATPMSKISNSSSLTPSSSSVPTENPPSVPPNNSISSDLNSNPTPKTVVHISQQGTSRKHKVWAGSLVAIIIVVIAVTLIMTRGDGNKLTASDGDSDPTTPPMPQRADSEIKLIASDGAELFGCSVAIDGDTIVIGAEGDNSAYVYTLSGTLWTQQAKLTASDGSADEQFGISVAIDGDNIVIGAPGTIFSTGNDLVESSSVNQLASTSILDEYIYVFIQSGTLWTEQAKLQASDGTASDSFGVVVAIDGDTIVVGSRWDDTENGGADSGSAYVYTLSGTVWTEQVKLTASGGSEDDSFGGSVAIDGDTIVIGAYSDNTFRGPNSGSAYVYTRSGTVWTKQAKLTASDGAEGDRFGNSVAVNVDADTIVIGAYGDDTENGDNSGSAYVYTYSGTSWTEQAKLTASDGAAYDGFGNSVAIDGYTIVIGAYSDVTKYGEDSCSAYVYTLSGTVWTEQFKLTASDGAANDQFGISVAISGDTIVIGAEYDDTDSEENSGSAYIFELDA